MGFIFDMGNVLSLDVDVLPCMAARLGMTVRRIRAWAREEFRRLLVGAETAEEFWQSFNRHFDRDVREDLLITCFHPANDPRMERLILDLKAAGHRVVCGTNALEKHYRYHLEHGEYAAFDHVYASNLMGIAKPSPEFFRHILEQEGWRAADTFFVDDGAVNIAAARDLGMHAFLYKSPRKLPALMAWLANAGAFVGGGAPEGSGAGTVSTL